LGLEYNYRAVDVRDDMYDNLERGFLSLKEI
jgi:hypothetical protein